MISQEVQVTCTFIFFFLIILYMLSLNILHLAFFLIERKVNYVVVV